MIDFTKPVTTTDGLPVRILATDVDSVFPVAAVITYADGTTSLVSYNAAGDGLINPPMVCQQYVVLCGGSAYVFGNRSSADSVPYSEAIVVVTRTDGVITAVALA